MSRAAAPRLPRLPDLDGAVELLERSLGHTRMALAGVRPGHLARPTPCARWDLDDLLWHMDDALDAFTEAAAGLVGLRPAAVDLDATGVEARLGRLQTKACHLLGAWSDRVGDPGSDPVRLGDLTMPATLLVGTAALEITVHGWDVGQATGERRPIPADLARLLMPVAAAAVDSGDRGRRFARPVPVAGATPADLRLLGYLGRSAAAAQAA